MTSRLVGAPLRRPRTPATLGAWLMHAADTAPPRAGLRFLDRREQETWFAWSDIADRALRAAGALAAHGVRRGDRVAVILPTEPAFADAFFGCQLLGAVPVALYPPVRLGRLDEYHDATSAMMRAVDARLLVTSPKVAPILGQTIARYRPPLGMMTQLTGAALPSPTLGGPDDLAMVQFSSGSTVDPKPVALTHDQVLAQTFSLIELIRQTGPDETRAGVSWLPLYHDMGLIGCIFPALCLPGPLTLIPPEAFLARPAIWLRALSRYGGTVSPAPDFAYNLCVERIDDADLEGVDLSAWALALNGAEPVRAQTLRAFTDRFAPNGFRPEAMTPVYGLSEAALAVTFDPHDRAPHVLRCDRDALATGRVVVSPSDDAIGVVRVGRPVPGFEVEIRDDEQGAVEPHRIGRVWARGPSLMRGYLHRDDPPIVDGWLDTGDLGFLSDGSLYLTGRAKDVVIVRGRNHAPHTLEAAVDGLEGVRTGCAVAVSKIDERGERVLLFIERRGERADLGAACREAVLAATGVPVDEVVVVEPGTLPRTSSGKLRRGETLNRYVAGTLAPPGRVTVWSMAGIFAKSVAGRWGWVVR